jgi:Fur family ferric uptake transcriptional regulator
MADSAGTKDEIERARDLLREHGLRCTASRIAVLQHLFSADAPRSHAEVADALVPDGFDRATLYRNLIDLTDVGIAARTDHGDHVWRFELRAGEHGDHDEHVHFVCTDCGGVTCLPDLVFQLADVQSAQFEARRVSAVVLRGVCAACD